MKKNLTCGLTALTMILSSCSTIPEDAPSEFHDAKAAIDSAEEKDIENHFPLTVNRAEDSLEKAVILLEESRDEDIEKSLRDKSSQEALNKAIQAKKLANQANDLNYKRVLWDEDIADYNRMKKSETDLVAVQDRVVELENTLNNMKPPQQMDINFSGPVAFFETGKTEISGRFHNSINQLANLLNKEKSLKVKLIGHADPRGSNQFNDNLAENRAKKVSDLLKQAGISANRIIVENGGEGSTASTAPGKLQLERRVEAEISTNISH